MRLYQIWPCTAAFGVGMALYGCDASPAEVEYKVSGSASAASLTMQNAQGGSEQMTVTLPYTRTLSVSPGGFVYIAAQNQGDEGGVTCEIKVRGERFKFSASYGSYTIATCSGSVPYG